MRKIFTLFLAWVSFVTVSATDVFHPFTENDLKTIPTTFEAESSCPAYVGKGYKTGFRQSTAVSGYIGFFEGDVNASYSGIGKSLPDLTSQAGMILSPTAKGTVQVPIVWNAGKDLFVVEVDADGNQTNMVESLTFSNYSGATLTIQDKGSIRSSVKLTGVIVEWPVKKDRQYYIFVTGSKISLYGFKFTEIIEENNSISFSEGQTTFTWGAVDTTLLPQLVNESNLEVNYSSSNNDVATIDAAGNVEVKATGETTISATTIEETPFVASYTLVINKAATPAPVYTVNTETGEVAFETVDHGTIHYTIDGTTPSSESPVYEGPFTVDDATTVKAYVEAADPNYADSEVISFSVLLDAVEITVPVVNQFNGTFFAKTEIPLAVGQYSLDGETWIDMPEAITLDETTTIYARTKRGDKLSDVITAEIEVPAIPAYTKMIVIGGGSFDTTDKTYFKGTAGNEARAYGMNLRLDQEGGEKNFSTGSKDIMIDLINATRGSIKGSNGRQCILEIPDNIKIVRAVLYAYINSDDGTNCGWKEVNGENYNAHLNDIPMVANAPQSGLTHPYKRIYDFETPVSGELTFTNGGRQMSFAMVVYIVEYAPAPTARLAGDEEGDELTELNLDNEEKTIVFTAAEGHDIYYNFEPDTDAPEAAPRFAAEGETPAEPKTLEHQGVTYTQVPAEGITLKDHGTLSYLAHNPETDLRSEVKTIRVYGTTTSLTKIEAEAAGIEYYNLQGIRVENPSTGLYIRRQGEKASKVYIIR